MTVNSGKRVTEENANVKFLLPNHPVLNFPNTIKADDFNQFDSWIITGTIEALNLKGFTEQANRLYTASQAETCQAINQVRFEITGETE